MSVPLKFWPITNPIAAAPMVPTTPWTDEAVPAIGAIFSIASVPRFDEVKANSAIVSPCKTMNVQQVLEPGECERGVNCRDQREGERARNGRHAAVRSCPTTRELRQEQRHRRRDAGEDQADVSPLVEGVEDDLLDRADVGDQRRRS